MEKIAIFGFGVIGSGVYDLIENKKLIPARVIKVFDRIEKKDVIKDLFCNDIDEILSCDDISTVVECLGGVSVAYEVITKALNSHKNVVTSNKEVVSLFLGEFQALARKNKVMFLFEASVGGGIPIIKNLCQLKEHDNINEVYGILNGTSNYILTEMFYNNKTLEESIIEAKRLGYAEADPTADLEGLDMVRKIAILAMLIENKKVELNSVNHMGISNITKDFVELIKKENKVCKLIVKWKKTNQSNEILVEPVVVSKESLLGNINGAYNGIFVECEYNGRILFNGLGAGKYATASAILADLLDIINSNNFLNYNENGLLDVNNQLDGSYYVICNNNISLLKKATKEQLLKASFYARII